MDSALITADMLKGITDAVSGNVGVIVPVGVTIMGIVVGVSMIPKILYKFL